MNRDGKVVTIDGPAGSGKGTVGQKLALRLGWHFLDSGALYRVCALIAREHSLHPSNHQDITEMLGQQSFRTIPREEDAEAMVTLNGRDVSELIRSPASAQMASKLATNGSLRTELLAVQRNYPQHPGLVADGRDMGSVVFPDADLKVYLDASPEARAKRKHIQLNKLGKCVNFDTLYDEIRQRDLRDSTRSHAPLAKPAGALVIDTSCLKPDEVLNCILGELNKVFGEGIQIANGT